MIGISFAIAAGLVVVGLIGYVPTQEKTALIPAGWGLAIAVCALLGHFSEPLRKHVMHLAMLIALLGVLANVGMWIGRGVDELSLAFVTQLLMALLCAVYVGLGIRSFVQARRARQGEGEG